MWCSHVRRPGSPVGLNLWELGNRCLIIGRILETSKPFVTLNGILSFGGGNYMLDRGDCRGKLHVLPVTIENGESATIRFVSKANSSHCVLIWYKDILTLYH
jgi:hypothetical protein